MEFIPGQERLCNYQTAFGEIPVSVNPIILESNLTNDGGSLYLEYVLDMDRMGKLKNRLNLKITKTA